jgi:hypothetical protein
MRRFMATAALAATMFAAVPASAATLFYIPGGKYAQEVHNDHKNPGNPITLEALPGSYDVVYTADSTITPNGNGFAQQQGSFDWLEIDPLGVSFSKMGFTLYPDAKGDVTFDILVTYVGGATELLSGALPSNGKVDVWGDALMGGGFEAMDKIRILNLMGEDGATFLTEVKHTSFEIARGGAPIPEPSIWAMMILGFGAVGTMVRSARRKAVAA